MVTDSSITPAILLNRYTCLGLNPSRYKQHQTDFEEVPSERPIALPCRVQGCRCLAFQYVHLNGSQPVRCRCKHSVYDHSETSEHLCGKCESQLSPR